jgi:ABC-type multidrug transport system ATPase subunit
MVQDLERIVDNVAYLETGKLRFFIPLLELKDNVKRIRAVFDGEARQTPAFPGELDRREDGRILTLIVEKTQEEISAALQRLGATNIEIDSLSLEDILVAYLKQGEESAKKEVAHV